MEKRRRGRPEDPDKLHFYSIGLRSHEWVLLEKFLPGANKTEQMRELIERVKKFWPQGPFDPPRCGSCGRFLATEDAICSCGLREVMNGK